ncbi:MAG: primosomal protein N' [Gammaproteobacteria bacterium]
MSNAESILKIGLNSPLDRLFDYLAPESSTTELTPGQRVRVPFGRSERVGILVATSDTTDVPRDKLKHAFEVIDAQPVLDAELMHMLLWSASYYQYPAGEVLAAALPIGLRKGKTTHKEPLVRWQITAAGRAVDLQQLGRRARLQADVLTAALEADLDADRLRAISSSWRKLTDTLAAKDWLQSVSVDSDADDVLTPTLATGPAPTAAQAAALEQVQDTGFQACLLEGVTGSGKTEVYVRLAERQLAAGRQTLILVPEIGLTPQLLERFRERLNTVIGVVHSGLNDTQRLQTWLDARSGKAGVVIGTRSAIFTPFVDLGLIVVDEEHDSSFKQQEGFRYSARDIAVFRARQRDIPVVMGSATPSFESLANALNDRYTHLRLPERTGSAEQPRTHLIDLRTHQARDGISRPLHEAIKSHLDAAGQVLVYLNRRGYAPTLICPGCGESVECKRCDARMVLHQQRARIACHHCGSETRIPDSCPECSEPLQPIGQGTERVETALQEMFPEYPLVRIDRDTTRRRGELEKRLNSIRSGESRILIGTQMLTKGHDFPDVTLVAIMDADQGLFGTDFRSSERLAQTFVQVAGRAGRAARAGEVYIQTLYPDHPLLLNLIKNGYDRFAEDALVERQQTAWPPFSHLALLRAECNSREQMFEFLTTASRLAQQLNSGQVDILGPATAPMERRSGRYRGQLLLQSRERKDLQQLLRVWRPQLYELPHIRRVRWSLDIDPIELF